jgi:hypothetical protein
MKKRKPPPDRLLQDSWILLIYLPSLSKKLSPIEGKHGQHPATTQAWPIKGSVFYCAHSTSIFDFNRAEGDPHATKASI